MSLEPELPCCLPMPSTDSPDLPSHNLRQSNTNPDEKALAINTEWFWDVGTLLHVRFLNRSICHEELVKVAAKTWEKYANIHFVFDDSPNAQIRIEFDEDLQGGRSLVGKCESDRMSLNKPTMVLGSRLGKESFQRTALHELGHALGCVHEHSSPVANIEWNEAKVIEWYGRKGYSEDWVRANIFLRYQPSDFFQTTLFDAKSIMIYPIFPEWAANITYIDWPKELSDPDKMLIGRIYRPIMPTTEIGSYRTQDSRKWYQPAGHNVKRVQLQNPHEKPLDFTIGITDFDLAYDRNMHLEAYADAIQTTNFDIHLDSMEGTTQYSAGATCLASERFNPTLQTGTYTTSQENTSDDKEWRTRINFANSFIKPPGLVVWLQAFHFEPGEDFNIHAYAEDIDETGFELCIDTWDNAQLKSAEASWVAYEKDPPGIKSGGLLFRNFQHNRQKYGDDKRHQIKEKGLGEWQLTKGLYAAISKFSFDSRYNIRLSVEARRTGESAFEVDTKTWADSVCHEVDVCYLAICS